MFRPLRTTPDVGIFFWTDRGRSLVNARRRDARDPRQTDRVGPRRANRAGLAAIDRRPATAGLAPTPCRNATVWAEVSGARKNGTVATIEDAGIWKLGAEPADGDRRTAAARFGEHGLTADVGGLTIDYARGDRGYLIASSQGSNTFLAYDRAADHAPAFMIDPRDGSIDDVNETDGVVVSQPLVPRFPECLLVVQDGEARSGGQNFELYDWEDVAGPRRLVDVSRPARPR